jgi:TPR repeat protein
MNKMTETEQVVGVFGMICANLETDTWVNSLDSNLALARSGDAEAMYQLSKYPEVHSIGQDVWLRKAAEIGHSHAIYDQAILQYEYFKIYCTDANCDFLGWDSPELEDALGQLRVAADNGCAPAQFDLAILNLDEYHRCKNSEKYRAEALESLVSGVRLLRSAAEKEHEKAQNCIGMYLALARGVEFEVCGEAE